MVTVVAVTVLLGICALFLLEYGDSHARIARRLDALQLPEKDAVENPVCVSFGPPATVHSSKSDAFSELSFTRSLLALSKVRSQDPYGSRAPERAESSSLVLVHPAQSQTTDREL